MNELGIELNTYIIDVVRPKRALVPIDPPDGTSDLVDGGPKVQLVSYAVVAPNPNEAMRRFFEEEAGEIIYEGDIVDRIAVGIEQRV